jgi:hypothetical protein
MRLVGAVQTLRDDLDERVQVEGLENRVADGRGRDLVDAALAGGGKYDNVRAISGVSFADLFDELVPVEARHHQVEKDEVDSSLLLQLLQTSRAILGELDIELHPSEHCLQKDANRQIIVDDEDFPSGAVELVHRHCVSQFHQRARRIPT